ncbi:hypothetical protein EDB84DRAFT_1584586 [Lactarius hengduanensis]|nr:hypothetical protein EDB84DRAFT_1584586 [Lactarius hengduanensis]
MSVPSHSRGRDARGHAAAPSPGHPRSSLPLVRAAPPVPLSPALPFPFARKEWARGHAAVSPLGPSLLHSRGKGAHEGTPPPCLRSHPFPLGRAAHSHRRGAYEGTPPPPSPSLPGASLPMKGCTRTRRPGTSPSPLATLPRTRRKGACEGTPPDATLPHSCGRDRGHAAPSPRRPQSPIGRAAPGTCGKGAREGMPPPAPRLPIRAEGVHARACRPLSPSPLDASPSRPVRAGWRHARARHPRPHPSPFARTGGARGHATPGPPLLPWATPPRTCGMEAREGTPPPARHPSPFARKGGARGHAAPSPRHPDTSHSRPPALPFSFGLRHPVCEGTPPPVPHPSPFARTGGGARGHAAPSPPLLPWAAPPRARGMRARDPWPHPSPFARKGGCTRACRPLSPSPPAPPLLPWAAPPHTRGMEAREGTRPGPTRCTEGTRPPIPIAPGPSPATPPLHPSPSCGRGLHEGTTPPAAPYARARHTRAHPSPFARKGAHRAHAAPYTQNRGTPLPAPPSLLSAPLCSRAKGVCEGKPPHPVAPRSHGNGRTRPSRVVQQGRRGLRAPAFTAPAPRLRGIQIVLVAAADVEAEALKAVGIVAVEEVGEAPMAVAVVAPHLSTELEFPEEYALLLVLETSSVYATETEDQSPDFFSPEGLAMNNNSVMDSRHTLRPNEAHNHLKPYLANNFVFRDANNVEGFSRIFASVNSRNKAWNSNQAQAFLDTIVRGNALLRIGDVLRFSPVTVNVGAGSSTLSYQKGYFPIIKFLSSDLVLKTTMHSNTNAIYALLDQNYDDFHSTTRECMHEMIEAQTWIDRSPGLPVSRQNTLSGVEVFGTLLTILSQYFARVKSAIKNHPELRDLVEDLLSWFNIWTAAVRASPPTFQDPITSSSSQIVGREYGDTEKLRRRVPKGRFTASQMQEALTSRLEQTYDPPGTLRGGGEPRHDNDFTDIRDIRIAPTNEELLCPLPPYLPFRLLREELISSIRQSVGEIRRDLETMWAPRTGPKTRRPSTLLEKLLSSKGGAYKTSGLNAVFFQLYTGANFAPLRAERRNFTVGLVLDSPPGAPRDPNGKREPNIGSILSACNKEVFLGTTISNGVDIAESAKANEEKIQLRVSFFDAEIELMALRRQPISVDKSTFAVLIDNKIMFEALHPFLRTLKDVEPTSAPFSAFISRSGSLSSMPVGPPRYTRVPRFEYNLQCLARPGETISSVNVNNVTSVNFARQELLRSSELDPSQVDAVIGTLTREISLIQGPPGTGKSFTGKEILRVLFSSKIKPIVLIAFTNHALDHMLTSVLDAKITKNVVRLGSRTTDERIEQYSLYKLEQLSGRGDLDGPIRRKYAAMKQAEEDMTRIMNRIQLPGLTWEDAERFLDFHHPQHADSFRGPPFWIAERMRRDTEDEIEHGEWTRVSKGKKVPKDAEISGVYGYWKNARDIEFIRPPPSSSKKAAGKKRTDSDPRVAFFDELGFEGQIPPVPSKSRTVEQLTRVYNVWSMSLSERQRLAESWEDDMRKITYDSLLSDFEQLRTHYKDACREYEDVQDEARRRLLSRTDLIACTTTGAAKLVSLLTSVGPKVLMVEEAGQVLEAHILASLVPSVEHLICIGDPKQLRPNLATFALSMDSMSGRELFKFDRSLMERLSDGGMSMSQINVQRRMRPSISHFVRTILYPKLEDHEVVRGYPAVQGMEKNVVFFSHDNPENSEDDSASKYNMFEVAMIRDLVLYFLKPGSLQRCWRYSRTLCLPRPTAKGPRGSERSQDSVSVDERDEEQLERTGLAGDVK